MFLVEEKKNDKNDFEKSLHFEGGGGVKANLEKVHILIFFFFMTASLSKICNKSHFINNFDISTRAQKMRHPSFP